MSSPPLPDSHSYPPSLSVPDTFATRTIQEPKSEVFGTCIHPKDVGEARYPCGTCGSCATKKASKWTARIERELKGVPWTPAGLFLTLTYAGEPDPDDDWQPVKGSPARRYAWAPAKGEGELLPFQRDVVVREEAALRKLWEEAIGTPYSREAVESLVAVGPGRARSVKRRIEWRQRRLDKFIARCLEPQPARWCITANEFKSWKKRVARRLGLKNFKDLRFPRVFGKREYGDKWGRPHFHVILIGPTQEQLDACIDAWGSRFNPADRDGSPKGRGHVHVLELSDARVTNYVNRDLNRGQAALWMEYLAVGKLHPKLLHVNDGRGGLGTGGWREHCEAKLALIRRLWPDDPYVLELCIQDTRRPRWSIRHQVKGSQPRTSVIRGTAQRRSKPEVYYDTCPDTVWRKFVADLEPMRDAGVRAEVAAALRERNNRADKAHSYEQTQKALRRARKRLEAWEVVRHRKGLQLPAYARREREYVGRKSAQQSASNIAACATGEGVFVDEEAYPADF